EPVRSYTTTALQPSGSIPVHPNMLSRVCPDYKSLYLVFLNLIFCDHALKTNGLTLLKFLSLVNPFRVKLIAPFFIFCLFVPTS
ncbi:hypothetical protein PAXRUDRAFT_178916, partial [Paxillus rubicundulus Ve08.2h10]